MAQTREDLLLLDRVHQGADIAAHSEVLFGGMQVAGAPFYDLYRECLEATRTQPKSWKVFRRAQRAYNFARYVERFALQGGPMVECGVFNGFSALLACRVLERLRPGYRGADLFLVDSFAGLSAPAREDFVAINDAPGGAALAPSHQQGHFAVGLDVVVPRFAKYPQVGFVRGWIPPVLAALPERRWSFVHIDVDLHEPTLACLEYFIPRMAPGGVIVNDDFSSPLFPGGGRAWMTWFDAHPSPYIVLDSGQSVYVAPR